MHILFFVKRLVVGFRIGSGKSGSRFKDILVLLEGFEDGQHILAAMSDVRFDIFFGKMLVWLLNHKADNFLEEFPLCFRTLLFHGTSTVKTYLSDVGIDVLYKS